MVFFGILFGRFAKENDEAPTVRLEAPKDEVIRGSCFLSEEDSNTTFVGNSEFETSFFACE
jgi:hypothetical protein